MGVNIVAVSDSRGAVYNPDGLNPHALLSYKRSTGSVRNYTGARAISPTDILQLPTDLLIPASIDGQITAENARRIDAKLIAEGSNGPSTPDADDILAERGILVVPDILANAGGVIVSYFEWVQDLQSFFWSDEEVDSRLESIIMDAFDAVWREKDRLNSDLRTAAYSLAIERVADATDRRGLYP
jgi:glutamate dehydrogenase (NAD(P)+)